MFRTASHEKDEYQAIIEETEKINEEFMLRQKEKFPKSNVVLRTGIYYVTPECRSTSYAIDAANYVRQKVKGGEKGSVRFYDDEMQKQRELENEIVNDMKEAMEQKQFKVYFQPQYSIKSHEIIGAEALVRWERDNGTVLSPNAFIPVYENNGKIIELDFYVFETVVEFIAENLKAGREQVPISINASSLHASDPQTINTYINILKKYSVDQNQRRANLFYQNGKEIIRYSMYMNSKDSSLGQKTVDNLVDEYEVENKGRQIRVEEYEVRKTKEKRYIAEFEYKGVQYQLKGIMEKEEFDKIIKNLFFM